MSGARPPVGHTGAVLLTITESMDGELAGNWSWTVWLLVPLALLLALITARCLGPGGEPSPTDRASGGVGRYLAERDRAGR